jgi:hypothetical protein
MATVLVTCPITGKLVSTGIETEVEVLKRLPRIEASIRCPACGEKHFWTCDDAMLADAPLRSATRVH